MSSRLKGAVGAAPETRQSFKSQVFYPKDRLVNTKSHAFLIGWNLLNFRCCISSIIELPYSEDNVALIQSALKNTGDLANIFQSCSNTDGAAPVLLGEWCPVLSADFAPSPARQASGIWIVLSLREGNKCVSTAERHSSDTESDDPPSPTSSGRGHWKRRRTEEERGNSGPLGSMQPQLHSIYSLGCSYKTSCYMIECANIDTDKLCCLQLESADSSTALSPEAQQKLFAGGEVVSLPGRLSPETDLFYIAAQINSSQDLHSRIEAYIGCSKGSTGSNNSKKGKDGKDDDFYYDDKNNKSSSSRGGSSLSAMSRSLLSHLRKALYTPLHWMLVLNAWLWSRCLDLAVTLLSTKTSILLRVLPLDYWLGQDTSGGKADASDSSSRSVALSDVSLCCAHLCSRVQLMQSSLCYCAHFPRSWRFTVATRQFIWTSVCTCSATVLVDLLLGCLFGIYLYNGCDSIMARLSSLCAWLQSKFLLDSLLWLNSNPAGLLLHPFVTKKLGDMLAWLVGSFGRAVAFPPLHRALVKLAACLGTFGLSVQLAFIVDVIRLLTFHIATIHRLLAVQHSFQVNLIYSLYYLFQGQKKNILRRRVDTCVYDMQQLLFGTVLFAIVFFLFPSFAAYFYLFATLQLLVVSLQGVIWLVVLLLISLPYYILPVSARDPYITQSLQFQLVPNSVRSKGAAGGRAKVVQFTEVTEEIGSGDDSFYDSNQDCSTSSPRGHSAQSTAKDLLGFEGGACGAIAGRPANKLLSLVRSKQTTAAGRAVEGVASDDVIYLSLCATPLTTPALLLPWSLWNSLLRNAQTDLVCVYNGFFSGRPALDLQLVQFSAALAEARLARSNARFCADKIFFVSIAGSWVDMRRAGAEALFWEETGKIYSSMSAADFDSKAYSVQQRLSSCLFQLVLCTHTVSQVLCCCGAALLLHSILL